MAVTRNATPNDRQLALAPLDEKVDHVRGSPAGRLIIEYGDYECPYSRQAFHAIERAGNYRKFLHGEAVSLGIVAACAISVKRAGLPADQHAAIVDLLERFELPTRLPLKFPRKKILDAVSFDKKFEGGKIRFVVTPRIGVAKVSENVTREDIREAIENL